MAERSTAQEYIDAGKNLTPLNGKLPSYKNWTEREVPIETVLTHSETNNIGWVMGEEDLVVDIDPRNGGLESFQKLKEFLSKYGEQIEETVTTPSGGLHIYYSIPEKYVGRSFRKTLKKQYPGIDFLTKGSQCVIVGGETEKGYYRWCDEFLGGFVQVPAPIPLISLILQNTETSTNEELGDFAGLIGGESSNWAEEKVLSMLEKLDPSMGNDEWVKVGMALHDWHPTEGLPLWEEWSKTGENYNEGDTEARWRSFDSGGGVTLGSISYMVKEVTYDTAANETNEFIQRIKVSTDTGFQIFISFRT